MPGYVLLQHRSPYIQRRLGRMCRMHAPTTKPCSSFAIMRGMLLKYIKSAFVLSLQLHASDQEKGCLTMAANIDVPVSTINLPNE